MKLFTKYYKRLRISYLKVIILAAIVSAFFLPYYIEVESTGDNTYMVILNGVECGTVANEEEAEKCLREARKIVALQSEELTFMEIDMELRGSEVMFGILDDRGDVLNNMTKVLRGSVEESVQSSYLVKVNDITVCLESKTQVERLLNEAIDQYDHENKFNVSLAYDPNRELNVLAAQISTTEELIAENKADAFAMNAGAGEQLDVILNESSLTEKKDFDDYDLGIKEIGFVEDVEVVEAYIPTSELTDYETALNLLTKEQEIQQIYTVVSGDTLIEISNTVGLPLDEIIALNDSLESEKSIIRVGQELIITVPEPELNVEWQEETYYEESYEEDIIYVDNDKWYTTQSEVLREPVAGYRKVVAKVTYVNDKVVEREIIKEEIVVEAVAKIVERGTITPPTFIKPLSGGKITSYFGKRNISLKGASTNHKGMDWGTPTGTSIYASSGGTVTTAGWLSGYGYCVYIKHANGVETRYAHLSKVLVSRGQWVEQGQKIALSGNTGRSTGPHLHFEIRVNGRAVDPLDYLD